jgi:hypothetical protein
MTRSRLFFLGLILLSAALCCAQAGGLKPKPRAKSGAAKRTEMVSQHVLDRLIAREKELASAARRHATAVIDEALAEDFHQLASDGRLYSKADIMSLLKEVRIEDFTLADFQTFALDRDCLIVTYTSTVKGDYKGQPFPPRIAMSSVWVHRGGSWRNAFHQVTPIADTK